MSLNPEDAERIPDRLIGMYSATELKLLGMMADAITTGIDTPDWLASQPMEMLRFRNAAQRLANGLSAAAPTVVGDAVNAAARMGRDAVDTDIDLAGHLAARSGRPAGLRADLGVGDRITDRATRDGVNALHQVNQALPGAAANIYQQVTARVTGTNASSELVRRQAVQQALDVLTARGITGFRDNAGRNWSLSTYVEMKSRTLVNNTLREAHEQQALARGRDLIVVSSHANPAPQCQPYEGQVLSIGPDAKAGSTIRPNATGGDPVKVKVKATLADARSKGLFHPNCKHATSIFIPGASRTFKTEPDPEGYKATQRQRAMERAIRQTKIRQATAIDSGAKKQLSATLRSQQTALKNHVAANDLKRRTLRERPDLGYKINPPDGLNSVPSIPTPKPVPRPSVPALRHPLPGDLPPVRNLLTADRGERLRAMRQLDGTYGDNLQLHWTETSPTVPGQRSVTVNGVISDNGKYAGMVERRFTTDDNGALVVVNEVLELAPTARGRGFATDLYATMDTWYEQSGVDRIEVHASLADGGYAWAKAGYAFDAELFEESTVLDRARQLASGKPFMGHHITDAAERTLLADAVQRMEKFAPTDPRFPTPQELVSLGADGKLGEKLMRGSSWDGVRKLKPRS